MKILNINECFARQRYEKRIEWFMDHGIDLTAQ